METDRTNDFVTAQQNILESQSPVGVALADDTAAKAYEAKKVNDNDATGAWKTLSAQNVAPGYDFKSAYAGGATFKPGPDGEVTLPNRFSAPLKQNIAGYDLATGVRYFNRIPDTPEAQSAIDGLRDSHINSRGEPPVSDVRHLSQIALDMGATGRGYADFDKAVPTQWSQDQRKLAWQAGEDTKQAAALYPKLEAMQQVWGAVTAPAKFTQEDTLASPEFAKDARTIHKLFWGSEFEGGDVDAAKWLREHLRWFDMNVVAQAAVMTRVRAADYKGVEAYSRAVEQWDNTAADLGVLNILSTVGKGLVDPTNLIGLGTGKVAVMTGARVALRQVLKQAGQVGAVAGGVGMGSNTVSRGIATGNPADAGTVARDTAIGATTGAGAGTGLAAAARGVSVGAQAGAKMVREGYDKLVESVTTKQAAR